jgi:hypothetical protein
MRKAADAKIPIVDTFKVFLSVPPRNIKSLTLQTLTEMENSSRSDEAVDDTILDDLLEELAPLTRKGNGDAGDARKVSGDWQTIDFRIRALPNSLD